MTNGLMRGSRPRGYKWPEWRLGQRGRQLGLVMGRAGRPGPTGLGSPRPSCLPPSCSVGFYIWALVVIFSPSWTKLLVPQDSTFFGLGPRSFSSSRVRSMGFLKSSLLHCMTFPGFKVLSRCLMNLSRKSCFQCQNPA
jgi:hypothetical protein